MTKTQVMQKVRKITQDIRQDTIRDIEHLLASGAVDLSSYDNNYGLPKILITAALRRNVANYDQQTPKSERETINLVRM